jgi:hypothetical protein
MSAEGFCSEREGFIGASCCVGWDTGAGAAFGFAAATIERLCKSR